MTWDERALAYGTDKASSHHGYMDAYEALLGSRRVERLLEIGVAGGRSLGLWAELFPDAVVVGVDDGSESMVHQRPRRPVVWAGAADAPKMAAVHTLYGPFDVVIDDGSHDHDEVRLAFEELYPRVADGGLYIIEDLDGSDPWVTEFVVRWSGYWVKTFDRVNTHGGLIVVPSSGRPR